MHVRFVNGAVFAVILQKLCAVCTAKECQSTSGRLTRATYMSSLRSSFLQTTLLILQKSLYVYTTLPLHCAVCCHCSFLLVLFYCLGKIIGGWFDLVGNVIGCINEVNRCWARLVLGWWRLQASKPYHYVTTNQPPMSTQAGHPSVSTNENWHKQAGHAMH